MFQRTDGCWYQNMRWGLTLVPETVFSKPPSSPNPPQSLSFEEMVEFYKMNWVIRISAVPFWVPQIVLRSRTNLSSGQRKRNLLEFSISLGEIYRSACSKHRQLHLGTSQTPAEKSSAFAFRHQLSLQRSSSFPSGNPGGNNGGDYQRKTRFYANQAGEQEHWNLKHPQRDLHTVF